MLLREWFSSVILRITFSNATVTHEVSSSSRRPVARDHGRVGGRVAARSSSGCHGGR
jgi:hypothetical protein